MAIPNDVPPPYAIPQYPGKRLRYFNNQFLNAQDFIDEDTSSVARERTYQRTLSIAGVCEGLTVTYPDPAQPPGVAAGTAIDAYGRLIVLAQQTSGSTDIPSKLSDGVYQLYIAFLEIPTDMSSVTAGGTQDNTRWTQQPTIAAAKPGSAPDGAVVLGSFTVATGKISANSVTDRQYSGVKLPGPTPNYGLAITGTNVSLFYPAGAHFSIRQNAITGAEVFTVDGEGSLSVSGTSTLTGLVTAKGGLTATGADAGVEGHGANAGVRAINATNTAIQALLATSAFAGDFRGNVTVAGDVLLSGKTAFRGKDTWLRLNDDTAFTSGVYTPAVLRVEGDVQLTGGKTALRGKDTWLRLNDDGAFSSGVYTPGILRVDGNLQVAGKNALQGNDTYLRLNQDNAFTSGVYTPGPLRTDNLMSINGALRLGASNWVNFPGDSTIMTDTPNYHALMIVGSNQNQGHNRWIRMWDDVQVEGALTVESGGIAVKTQNTNGRTGIFSGIHVQAGGGRIMNGVFGLGLVNSVPGYYSVGIAFRGALYGHSHFGQVPDIFEPYSGESSNISDGPRTSDDGRIQPDCCQVFWNVTNSSGFQANGYVTLF